MTKFGACAVVAIALALAGVVTANGQGPDVKIAELDCNGDPERVILENKGDASQEFAGWELQSDPPDSEVFQLIVLGGLEGGASVFIESGPSASSVFKWGDEFIFRDDDPTDYVRLVDDAGTIVDQVNCAEAANGERSPTPSPEPSPAADVPNGGGAPPTTDDLLSSAMMVVVGGIMAGAGLMSVVVSRLRPPGPS